MNNLEIIFTEPRKVALVESTMEKPGEKEVLVKVKYNVISAGTEKAWLMAMENAKGKFPFNVGYSSVGTVVDVGKEVKKFKCGDRVFVVHGGHASYNLKNEGSIIRIPNEVSFEAAVFTRMASFPLLAIRRARLEIGESIVIVGLGMVGLFGVQIARLGGAMPLVAVGNRDIRREKAYKYGADLVLSPDEPDLINKIIDFTYERNQVRGANCVIETSGSERGIIDSLKYVSFGGRLLLNGCNRINEEPVDFYKYVHTKGVQIIGAHECTCKPVNSSPGNWTRYRDYITVLGLMADGRIDATDMISEYVSPQDAALVYKRLLEDKNFPLGVVFDWDEI